MVSPINNRQVSEVGIYCAEPADVPRLASLARKFHAEIADSGYLEDFPEDFWVRYWRALLDEGLAIMLYCADADGEPVGLVAATVAVAHTDGAIQVSEALWYVDSQHRRGALAKRLVSALEMFAHGAGAKRVAMAHLVDDTGMRLSRLFVRWGYKPFEVGYIKEVEV